MDESLNLQTPGSDERTSAQTNQRISLLNGAPRQSHPSDAVTEGVEGDGLRRRRMPPKRSARSPSSSRDDKEAGAIAAELRRRRGDQVRFDAGRCALYAVAARR